MTGKNFQQLIRELLQTCGIQINGNQPWDVKIYDDALYSRVLRDGSLGLGEAYVEGWWDCDALDELFYRLIRAELSHSLQKNKTTLLSIFLSRFFNFQTKSRALEVGRKHYDLGNTLFENMLDPRMNYTCAYWKDAATLEEAQLAKLELVCQKLQLTPGMSILDIGCGWGAFAKYAAEIYGAHVIGVTISEQQVEYAQKNCAGLPVEIRFQDYRDVIGRFDRIVSLGMFEHVEHANYAEFFTIAHRCLTENGLFLLHTIGSNKTTYMTDEWIQKYIFPNGMLPSLAQIGKATENLWIKEDLHNIGIHYDKTLMAWQKNFQQHWEKLKTIYDERFYRMWNYYLQVCAGSFRARDMQVWQIIFSKQGRVGEYQAIR